MPLHEYLEQKRRQNIDQLNQSSACHICGSNSRNTEGFHHAVNVSSEQGGNYNENSMVRPPNISAMRICACFGNTSPDSDDYWPYSLRVCERCIQDDIGIGRIRNCGICGMVACDENCGVELLECTDNGECTNLGCIECRKMSDFSEIEIYNSKNIMSQGNMPRMTRVCISCLEQSTPWIRYDFKCKKFRCETKLVQSDIAERKRCCTFGRSSLNLLPEDGLVNVASYLSGDDLKPLFFTCSAMCTVAERTAREKVERISDDLLTGPIYIGERKDGFGQKKPWTHFEGKNDFGLRAPDDEKSWVGLYHYIEKVIEETYYFGFQMKGEDGDKDIVNRFINMRSEEKFSFGQTYSKVDNDDGPSYFVPSPTVGLMIRGGTALVTNPPESPSPVVIASRLQLPSTGITRVLCRVFAPGVGGARGNNRDAQGYKLGSIGILRLNQTDEGAAANQWAQRQDVMEPWVKEETVFGFQFDADEQTMIIHGCSNLSRSSRYNSNRYTVRLDTPGDLHIGFELAQKQLGINKALLSARNCDEDEWTKFLAHSAEHNAPIRGNNNVADMYDPVHALEVLNNAQGEGGPQPLRIRHQIFRQAVHNRRRERAAAEAANGNNNNDNVAAGNVHRVQVRVLDNGRRIAQMLPRNPPPQQQQAQGQPRPRVGLVQLVNDRIIARGPRQQADVQAQINHAQQLLHNAARAAPFNVGVAGQGAPRRIVRAIRPPQAAAINNIFGEAIPPQVLPRNNAQPQGMARRMFGIDMGGVVPRAAGDRQEQQNDVDMEDASFDSQETIPFRRHYDPDDNL